MLFRVFDLAKQARIPDIVCDLVFLAGLVTIIVALWCIYVPLAWLTAGVLLIIGSLWWTKVKYGKQNK